MRPTTGAERAALALLLAAALAACSVNPATGKRELMLIGESDEVRIGRDADRELRESVGVIDDASLQAYVAGLGRRLAARSERPTLDWTFRVVDDPAVNAFALPGGFVYVTRGILAHLESEAELAGVIGHEIGHVTARHGASQMSKQALLQLGLGAGTELSDGLRRYGGLLETGLGLLFLKYSRDDERQADELGLRYVVRAGIDPRPMPQVFDMLERVGRAEGSGRVPGWLSSHPAPANRRETIRAEIEALAQDFSTRDPGRDAYVRRLDGLVFGEDPRQGYFEGSTFRHPELRLRVDLPEGWTTRHERRAVAAASTEGDAALVVDLAGEATPALALDAFFRAQARATRGAAWRDRVSGLACASSGFAVDAGEQPLRGLVAFVQLGNRVVRLLGYAAAPAWNARRPALEAALGSFGELTDTRALAIEPARIRIVEPARAQTLAELARSSGVSAPVETIARINGIDATTRVSAGRPYKIVVGGR